MDNHAIGTIFWGLSMLTLYAARGRRFSDAWPEWATTGVLFVEMMRYLYFQ